MDKKLLLQNFYRVHKLIKKQINIFLENASETKNKIYVNIHSGED